MTPAPMTRSTPKLSEVARHLKIPQGITSSNFPRVYRRLQSVGVSFDTWQRGFGSVALGCREDGKYAATVGGVVASIPRQVGKTFTIGNLLIGLALEFPNTRIVWTSHHSRTTTNTFRSMQGLVKRKQIAPLMAAGGGIRTANGEQEIAFANGSLIMFGAREHGFGRGMDAIDVVVFDEAQILSIKALEDMVPAANQSRHPHGALVFFIGTPPRPTDEGDAFASKRDRSLKGEAPDSLFVEFSAPVGAESDDRSVWPIMNPSYPLRTPLEAMLRMRENIPDEGSWRREAMGIWDEKAGATTRLIPADAWKDTESDHAPDGVRSLAVTFSFDGSRQAVGGAVKHDDGVHVELVGAQSGPADSGTASLVKWLTVDPVKPERWRSLANIAIAGGGEAGTLFNALHVAGVPKQMMHVMTTPQVLAANSMMLDRVRDRTLTHPVGSDSDVLDSCVAAADQKMRPSGWSWKTTDPDGDVLPIEVVCMALWVAVTSKRAAVDRERSSNVRGRPSGRRMAGRR